MTFDGSQVKIETIDKTGGCPVAKIGILLLQQMLKDLNLPPRLVRQQGLTLDSRIFSPVRMAQNINRLSFTRLLLNLSSAQVVRCPISRKAVAIVGVQGKTWHAFTERFIGNAKTIIGNSHWNLSESLMSVSLKI